ncbi:hypothetical protein, partial [Vibrio parahaemolyticus]
VDKLHQLFSRYEFKRWLSDVENGTWMEGKGSTAKANPAIATSTAKVSVPTAPTLNAENYQTILEKADL